MKNKIFSAMLVISLVLSVSACGKTESNTTTTNESTTTPTTATQQITNTTPSTAVTEAKPVTETTHVTTTETPTTEVPETSSQIIPTGISSKAYEGNAEREKQIVYYPAELETANKQYPVVAWANGTMCTPDIYANLLKDIAEGGFIVVASYETMSADGTAQIDSIDLMIAENSNSASVFYNKVNTEKIAVIGHSQGGRSSVNVSSMDSRVDCVVSVAGSNFDYEAEKNSKPTLFLAGSNDIIVNKDQWIIPAYDLANGPAVYACLDGAIHTTCCSNPEKYAPYIIDWLNIWLRNSTSAKAVFQNGGKLSQDTAWTGFSCKNL